MVESIAADNLQPAGDVMKQGTFNIRQHRSLLVFRLIVFSLHLINLIGAGQMTPKGTNYLTDE